MHIEAITYSGIELEPDRPLVWKIGIGPTTQIVEMIEVIHHDRRAGEQIGGVGDFFQRDGLPSGQVVTHGAGLRQHHIPDSILLIGIEAPNPELIFRVELGFGPCKLMDQSAAGSAEIKIPPIVYLGVNMPIADRQMAMVNPTNHQDTLLLCIKIGLTGLRYGTGRVVKYFQRFILTRIRCGSGGRCWCWC
ncbi:MAG: hypothetical protein BWY82_02488 [Verrucomicrobia bacterium ADurb.Bin474]|nr:MAG: hypothetical protein BWY82_02488 [Verrucomicrobia bacterium ADurb.Bin474]